ncbi:MAG TPA: hypothetical protein VJB65_03770 [Patescibacteria group bacterium]|nr:hypothetical protein [Patescibacteria group bacterium]
MESPHPKPKSVIAKEMIVLFLVAALAGLIIVTATDKSALGILNETQQKQAMPSIPTLSSNILEQKGLLQLDVDRYQRTRPTQTMATFTRQNTPPQVEKLDVFDDHSGEKLVLYWTLPLGVQYVSIYKRTAKETEEKLIVDKTTAQMFIDTNVQDGTTYEYRAVSVIIGKDKKEYTASVTPTVTITPHDTLAPQHPMNVVVTIIDTEEKSGLHIQWDAVLDEDVDHYTLFRSEQFGTRGTAVATVPATEKREYLDSTVQPNDTYYYTVVAYDVVGNGSSDNFSLPTPGNSNPFSPIVSTNE